MQHRKIIVCIAALTTILMAIPPNAAAATNCDPAGGSSCTFADGDTLRGTYAFNSITIPAGVTVFTDGPVSLHAAFNLEIAGTIIGSAILGAGDLLDLRSDLSLTISGSVLASRGAPGGSIIVTSQDFDISGLLEAGDGLDGVGDAGPHSAAGGAGHAGGSIIVAGTGSITGEIHLGNGGEGGYAIAWSDLGRVASIGGAGGTSGNLIVPPIYTVAGLYSAGILTGGIGGDGGYAFATQLDVPVIGENGAPDYDEGRFWCHGNDAQSVPEHGQDGCLGGEARAFGGPGAYGDVQGGKGGKATSQSGPGGRGGGGSTGIMVETVAYRGSDGGRGGSGGLAYADGGRGGNSKLFPGAGGDVKATTGAGANGGRGGNGFGVWNSWEPEYCKTYASPSYCYHGTAADRYCVPAGQGGPGGGSTDYEYTVTPGSGGTSTANQVGPRGIVDPTSARGPAGLSGANGSQAGSCGDPPYQPGYKEAFW